MTITLTYDLISIRYNNSFIRQIESRAIKVSLSSLNHTFSFCCLEVWRSITHKSSNHFTQETQALRNQSLVLTQISATPEGSSDFFFSVIKEESKYFQYQFLIKNVRNSSLYFPHKSVLCLKCRLTTNHHSKNYLELELNVTAV